MGRYIVTIVWSVIYMLVVGFIAGPLTQSASFNVTDMRNCVIVGVILKTHKSAIIATITKKKKKDNSKYSKLK